jgi:hypothetical protein
MHSILSRAQAKMYWVTDQKIDGMGQEFSLAMEYIYQDIFI